MQLDQLYLFLLDQLCDDLSQLLDNASVKIFFILDLMLNL